MMIAIEKKAPQYPKLSGREGRMIITKNDINIILI
jgi:hypothetical protein